MGRRGVAVTGGDDERNRRAEPRAQTPWHHSTAAVLGASLLGVLLIAVLVAGGTFLARQIGEPTPAPTEFIEPSFATTPTATSARRTTTATGTTTRTSTSPPITTDSSGPRSTSPTEAPTETTPSEEASTLEETTTSSEPAEQDDLPTRKRPRTNITRTLYPLPDN